jgi:hypothetical protein
MGANASFIIMKAGHNAKKKTHEIMQIDYSAFVCACVYGIGRSVRQRIAHWSITHRSITHRRIARGRRDDKPVYRIRGE